MGRVEGEPLWFIVLTLPLSPSLSLSLPKKHNTAFFPTLALLNISHSFIRSFLPACVFIADLHEVKCDANTKRDPYRLEKFNYELLADRSGGATKESEGGTRGDRGEHVFVQVSSHSRAKGHVIEVRVIRVLKAHWPTNPS